jgi:hypothetical protein
MMLAMRVTLVSLLVATMLLSAGAGPRQRDRGIYTFKADSNGTSWSIDCTKSKRDCVTDFDGGWGGPIRCPAGDFMVGGSVSGQRSDAGSDWVEA